MIRSVILFQLSLLIFFMAGCKTPSDMNADYAKLWVSDEQANPRVVIVDDDSEDNLSSMRSYDEQKVLLAKPALTPLLVEQMTSFGFDPTLKDFAEIFTQQLEDPGKVSAADAKQSAWILGLRNTLFGTEKGKVVELHMNDAGLEVLALKRAGGDVVSYYEEVDGELAEYLWDKNAEKLNGSGLFDE